MSLSPDKLKRVIELIKSCEEDFELKDVHYDKEYEGFCKFYFEESVDYLKGVLYYMDLSEDIYGE